jgi:hypothetical protein
VDVDGGAAFRGLRRFFMGSKGIKHNGGALQGLWRNSGRWLSFVCRGALVFSKDIA